MEEGKNIEELIREIENSTEIIDKLLTGEELDCPVCKVGKIMTIGKPSEAEYFFCNNAKCNVTIRNGGIGRGKI